MSRSSSTGPGGGQTLFKDARYAGKYVAMRSFTDRNIVAVGGEPSDVLEEAPVPCGPVPLIERRGQHASAVATEAAQRLKVLRPLLQQDPTQPDLFRFQGLPIFDSVSMLGKENTLARIDNTLKKIETGLQI